MKNTFLSLLCFGLTLTGQLQAQNNPSYQISGELKNVPGNTITISTMNQSAGYLKYIDTIALKDGKFGFNVPYPYIATIYISALPTAKIADEPRQKQIFLVSVPGEKAIVNGSLDNYTITGSPFYDDLNEMLQTMQPLVNQWEDTNNKYALLLKEKDCNQDSIATLFGQEQDAYMQAMSDAALQYIQSHPDQEASAILIATIDPQNSKKAVNALSDKAKTPRMIEFYKPLLLKETEDDIKGETVTIPTQDFESINVGDSAPEFTLKDINDKDFTLSSLRGKYVVLDFWGNWCGWCIKGIPDMKGAYTQYKDKVEFVGIDCNDTPEVWKKAVAKYELPWIQVYNSGVPQNVASLYNVEAYPSKYIIDPEGKLIHIVVGEDPAFYEYLDELMK